MGKPKIHLKTGFGARLREARIDRNATQAEIAELCGIDVASINHFEAERRYPSFANIIKLSNALEVSADYLLKTRCDESDSPARLSLRDEALLKAFRETMQNL